MARGRGDNTDALNIAAVTRKTIKREGLIPFPMPAPLTEQEIFLRAQLAKTIEELKGVGIKGAEVGGMVRDRYLGRTPDDFDFLVIGETPESLLAKAKTLGSAEELIVGDQLVGVRLKMPWLEEKVELALARTEVSTGDKHTDFKIVAGINVTMEEDLARRDFTVNAIAKDYNTQRIIDPFGGVKDIENRILRTVSPDSFRDDPLRILRGLARISKDGLDLAPETSVQMKEWAHGLKHISGERIREELEKIFKGKDPAHALRIARDHGVLEAILPEFKAAIGFDQESRFHDLTADEHILLVLQRASEFDAPETVKWAALLHDIGKPASAWRGTGGNLHFYHNRKANFVAGDPYPIALAEGDVRENMIQGPRAHESIGAKMTEEILERIHADKKTIKKVRLLVREHMYGDDAKFITQSESKQQIKARKFIARIGRENVEELMLLRRCDHSSKDHAPLEKGWDANHTAFETVVRSQMDQPLTIKELDINGDDLGSLGLKGREIGDTLRDFLDRIIVNPEYNNKERMMNWARKIKQSK